MLGVDPDQLEEVARGLQRGSTAVQSSAALAIQLRATTWSGPGARRCHHELIAPLLAHAEAAVQALSALAAALQAQAHEQRHVSRGVERRLILIIPGMGTDPRDPTTARRNAEVLQEELDRTSGPLEEYEVRAWSRYPAPPAPSVDNLNFAVLNDSSARIGARNLEADLNALAAHDPDRAVTAIGHSYGSLVAAQGVAADTTDGNSQVDQLILLASPGVGADSAEAIAHETRLRVQTGAFNSDPVALSQWFGPNPTSPEFGSQVLRVEAIDSVQPLRRTHSSYFEPGSPSLNQIAAAVAQHPLEPAPQPGELAGIRAEIAAKMDAIRELLNGVPATPTLADRATQVIDRIELLATSFVDASEDLIERWKIDSA